MTRHVISRFEELRAALPPLRVRRSGRALFLARPGQRDAGVVLSSLLSTASGGGGWGATEPALPPPRHGGDSYGAGAAATAANARVDRCAQRKLAAEVGSSDGVSRKDGPLFTIAKSLSERAAEADQLAFWRLAERGLSLEVVWRRDGDTERASVFEELIGRLVALSGGRELVWYLQVVVSPRLTVASCPEGGSWCCYLQIVVFPRFPHDRPGGGCMYGRVVVGTCFFDRRLLAVLSSRR